MTDDLKATVIGTAFDLDAVLAYVDATSTDWRRTARKMGIQCVHDWLSGYPGATWQEKWVAADGDQHIKGVFEQYLLAGYPPGTPVPPKSTRSARFTRHGLGTLVELGLVRPGPDYLIFRAQKVILQQTIETHAETIEAVIDLTARATAVSTEVAWVARHVLGMMIATTGKALDQITVEDWITVERAREDILTANREHNLAVEHAKNQGQQRPLRPDGLVTPDRVFSLRWAYSACVRAGAIAPHPHPPQGMAPVPVNLSTALAKPKTIESLLDSQADVLPGRLYDFVRTVFEEHYAGHDFSTRRGVVGYLGAYLRAVEKTIPGNHSLRVQRSHAAKIIEHLSELAPSAESTSTNPREATSAVLQSVRRFYGYANETAEDFDQYKDLSGPFPISANVVTALSRKYHKRRRSNLQGIIRSAITTIDDLVPATQIFVDHINAFVAAAQATPDGGTFTYRNVEYRRHDTPTHPSSRPMLNVRRAGGARGPTDLLALQHRAVRVRALIVVLRHTGIRREEAIDIARDDLGFARIDGTKVPCLHVGPAKTDSSRTVPMHNEVIQAFIDLIRSYDRIYGEVPMAVRRDQYERQTYPARRYLFQAVHMGSFVTPGISTVTIWVRNFIDEYNEIAREDGHPVLRPLRPHDFRRMFATDLLEKDVPIESVRHLMGHVNLATTAVYDHTTWDRAAAKFVESHRGPQTRRTGLASPCPHCHGTGRVEIEPG